MIDTITTTLKAFLFLNAALGFLLIFLARMKLQTIQSQTRDGQQDDGFCITYVFLGLLGEMKYLEPLCREIPGTVIYVQPTREGYNQFESLRLVIDDFVQRRTKLSTYRFRVKMIGVSLGAQLAMKAAVYMADHYGYEPELYLLNPCMGRSQIGLCSLPNGLRRILLSRPVICVAQLLCLILRCGLGIMATIRIRSLHNHSLAMLIDELLITSREVKLMSAKLMVSRCHVVLSRQDNLIDIRVCRDYFYGCLDNAEIDAGHCDFVDHFREYHSALSKCGLYQ